MKKAITILTFLFISLIAMAEGVGTWTIFPSYANITEIQPAGNKCFVLASGNLYSYKFSDEELQTYSKNDVLSDNTITHIAWSQTAKRLIIVYSNSNIDLLSLDDDVLSAPDLYQKTTTDDKTINHILVSGKWVYLSVGYGIVRMNAMTGEFTESYRLGFAIDYTYLDNGYLYAMSPSEGALRCRTTDNMLDPARWEHCGDYVPNTESRTRVYDPYYKHYWVSTPKDGQQGTFLLAYNVDSEGVYTYLTEGFRPDGPVSGDAFFVEIDKDKVYVAPGAYVGGVDMNNVGNVMVLKDGSWSEYQNNIPELTGLRYFDVDCIAVDPTNRNHVFSCGKNGLFEFMDGKFVKDYRFGYEGVPLASAIPDNHTPANWTVVESMTFDKAGNLWVMNYGNSNIVCLTKEGTWKAFDHKDLLIEPYNYHLRGALVDSRGLVWFCASVWENSRLYCYDPATDKLTYYKGFVNQDGTSYTAYLFALCEDKLGNIWVGTNCGPFYISVENILLGNQVFTQHKVPRNDGTNLADYLLTGMQVNCITVDNANRKWIGTNDNGVYLISDDNNVEEQHFTVENSPLPSNGINDIKVDPQTGRVFIATGAGLCSYMSDVTETSSEMSGETVYAYPNPVTPEYTGMITIVGLEPGSDVKILTTSGRLVNEGTVSGGSYKWDGCNKNGERVASGMYMVNVAKKGGESGVVTKIAVVR